jgi:hypothetical protein
VRNRRALRTNRARDHRSNVSTGTCDGCATGAFSRVPRSEPPTFFPGEIMSQLISRDIGPYRPFKINEEPIVAYCDDFVDRVLALTAASGAFAQPGDAGTK